MAYKLINQTTKKEVKVGDKVTDFRGETGILTDVTPLTGMNGHIYMDGNQYYPSVIGCKFVEVIKPKRIRRKTGEHRWHEHDGITKCFTCFCDEDDAFVGGQECSFKS